MGWALFALWEVFWFIWTIFAFFTTVKNERLKISLTLLGAVVFAIPFTGVAIWITDSSFPEFFLLSQRNLATIISGFFFTVLGLIFAVWSRAKLGNSWSGEAKLVSNQKLITDGPYKVVRHPIYTGQIVAVFGTAIILLDLIGIALFIVSVITLVQKSIREENLLTNQFGTEYIQYKKRVKMLIPYII
jgi:protein-S-isoprenylcysteine O-methyltransferase Ste14